MLRTLPGGMPPVRAVRLILTHRPWALIPAWLARCPVVAGLAVGLGVWLLDHAVLHLGLTAFLIIPLALLVAATEFFISSAGAPGQLHPIGPQDQPGLHALVAEVAEQLGVRRPVRIWLWAWPDSIVKRPTPWRTELWLGLPYATEMTVDELRAVVAYELTLAEQRRSWLVGALYEVWGHHLAWIRSGKEVPEPFMMEIGDVVEAVIREADRAGVRVAGPEVMGSALLRGAMITGSFTWFATRYVGPLVERRRFATDLYAGWRWKLRSDRLLDRGWPRFRPFVLEDPRPACSWTNRLSAVGGSMDTPPQPAQQVLLSGMPEAVEGRFSRYVARALAGRHVAARATRFHDVPPDVWDGVVRRQLEEVVSATARLLGEPTVAPLDVVAVVRAGRASELTWDHRDWMCTHATPGVCALFPVIHHALRAAGYEYDKPLRQRELVGPDGDRVDVTELAERIEHGEPQPQQLSDLLDG